MRVWEKFVIADYSFDFKAILFLWFEILVVSMILLRARQQQSAVVISAVDCMAVCAVKM